MDSVSNESLATLLTHERLATYLKVSNDDLTAALQLYNWNIDVTTAALAMTAMVEIPLRNALDHQLTCWAHGRGSQSWFDLAPLYTQGRRDLAKATQRAGAGRRPPTHVRFVAVLSFGFWRFLLSRRYLTTLWIPALQHAFPNTDLDANSLQRSIENDVQQLHFLRNRAAHHEPLLRRDLHDDLERARHVMTCISPVARNWLDGRQLVSDVVAKRPKPPPI